VFIVLGVLVVALIMWFSPTVPVVLLGGFAVALVLSFPVRWLSYIMPRWLAMLITFLALLGIGLLAFLILIPILVVQLVSFVKAAPEIVTGARKTLVGLLQPLADYGLLKGTPDEFMGELGQDLLDLARSLGKNVLGSLVSFVSNTISLVLSIFGVLFVSVYLLANVRKLKATFLVSAPKGYRRDAHQLWDAFAFSFSRYLSGLDLDMFIQGAISAVGLSILGVPYALLLGTWVSVTAIIPWLGAWLGAIPAVIVAFTVSPTTALLTALFYLVVQQLEGNVLYPVVVGRRLRLHPVAILLALTTGGVLAGVAGAFLAVPALAVGAAVLGYARERRAAATRTVVTT